MGVSLWIRNASQEIGTSSFLYSFFSTVAVRLECDVWGSRFPITMNVLYKGWVPASQVFELVKELMAIRSELASFGPAEIVWNYEDRNAQPPWGTAISPTITTLAQYWVTSAGKNLFDVFDWGVQQAQHSGDDLIIQ